MQWISLHRPHTARYIHDQAEAVLRRHRPQPASLIFRLNRQLEYRNYDLHDPAVLLNPDTERIGRKIHDVLPSALMERFDRCLYQARKTGLAGTYTFPVNGQLYKGTIVTPTFDSVLCSVTKVL